MLTRRHALAGLALAGTIPPGPAPASAATGPKARRFGQLARGLNASLWFDWVPGGAAGLAKLDRKYQAADFTQIHQLGFTHIRVPIQPEWLAPGLVQGRPDLDPDRLRLLDTGMARILSAGLAVVLDSHPTEPLKNAIVADRRIREAYAGWWRAFAGHVGQNRQYDPERCFLELFNEPNGRYWDQQPLYRDLIQAVIEAIRGVNRDHTLIVGGTDQNAAEAVFTKLRTPFADENCIYTFHFYRPLGFTHQGADWAGQGLGELSGLSWGDSMGGRSPDAGKAKGPPAAPGSAPPGSAATLSPRARQQLQNYASQPHDKTALQWSFIEIRKWCQRYGQLAWVGEFGVYRRVVAAADRAAWIRQVRELAEENGIGWCLWEAIGDFGLFLPGEERPLHPDPAVIAALGIAKT